MQSQSEKIKNNTKSVLESPDTIDVDAESIIQESRERIMRALEMETDRLQTRTKEVSSQIIANAQTESSTIIEAARQEAEQIITAAREQAAEDSDRRIAEARQKAEQVIRDAESSARDKARESAEHEAEHIIAKANEEADKIRSQAEQEAKIELDKMMGEARKEAERVVTESREKAYAEAQQESARIISENKKKSMQIMMDIVEHFKTQTKNEFIRSSSEVRIKMENEMSSLFTQVTGNIEQIVNEIGTNIQAEFEHFDTMMTEEEGEQTPVDYMSDEQNDDILIAEEEVDQAPVDDVPDKQNDDILMAEEEVDQAPVDDVPDKQNEDIRLYEGQLTLLVPYPFDEVQPECLKKCLDEVPGLTVLSEDIHIENSRPFVNYVIHLGKPAPLLKILKYKLQVKDVVDRGGDIELVTPS